MSQRFPLPVRIFARLVQWWLPDAVYRESGQPTTESFADLYRDAHRGWGRARLMLRELASLGAVALRERWDAAPIRRRRRRATSRASWMAGAAHDLRYAARSLRKQPIYAVVVIGTLALGIGANTALFAVIHGVLFAPLPYADAESLVRVFEHDLREGEPRGRLSTAELVAFRERSTTLQGIGAFSSSGVNVPGEAGPERAATQLVTPGVFELLGVPAALGRVFEPDDHGGDPRAIILSHAYWQRRFGGDTTVMGTTLALLGESPQRIVGIMPPAFRPLGSEPADLWLPWGDVTDEGRRIQRFAHPYQVVARVGAGYGIADARNDLSSIAAQLETEESEFNEGHRVRVESLADSVVSDVRQGIWLMMGAVGLVLVVACANLSNLTLARAIGRRHELAVRAALGAGWRRAARQIVIESLLLTGPGAVGALIVAGAVFDLSALLESDLLPRADLVHLGVPAGLFAFGIAVATAGVIGTVALLDGRRASVADTLRDDGTRLSPGRRALHVRSGLVIGQVALSIMLLVGAGLLVRSFERLIGVDPGFRTDNIAVAEVVLPAERYRRGATTRAFLRDVEQRLRDVPGVTSVGTVSTLPFTEMNPVAFHVADRPGGDGAPPEVHVFNVSGAYYETMGIPLLAGRWFDESDTPQTPRVALVNESLAREHFPNESPIGRRVLWGPDLDAEPFEIVGVVADTRQEGFAVPPFPALIMNANQFPWWSFFLTVRMQGAATDGMSVLRRELRAADPELVPWTLTTMTDIVDRSVARRRVSVWLTGGFSLVALIVALVGIYGVMAYSVSERRREIGLRMALGATSTGVLNMVVRQGIVLAGWGAVAGTAVALAATTQLRNLLYDVSPRDPVTFLVIPALLIAVAAAASYLPAARAANVDPVRALRNG